MESFDKSFQISDNDLQKMVGKANDAGVKFNSAGFDRSKEYIRNYVKALVAKSEWKMDGFFYIFNKKDNVFVEAQKHWEDAVSVSK